MCYFPVNLSEVNQPNGENVFSAFRLLGSDARGTNKLWMMYCFLEFRIRHTPEVIFCLVIASKLNFVGVYLVGGVQTLLTSGILNNMFVFRRNPSSCKVSL